MRETDKGNNDTSGTTADPWWRINSRNFMEDFEEIH